MQQSEQRDKPHYMKSNLQPHDCLYSFYYTWLDIFFRFSTWDFLGENKKNHANNMKW